MKHVHCDVCDKRVRYRTEIIFESKVQHGRGWDQRLFRTEYKKYFCSKNCANKWITGNVWGLLA